MLVSLADEAATCALGKALAQAVQTKAADAALVIYLDGDLGAGKTTFSRGFIQAFGHMGAVKSPTYTLVEPYELSSKSIYHFDLYRLADPEELEYIGLRDFLAQTCVCIFEWPEKGRDFLPAADIAISLELDLPGRKASFAGLSPLGETIVAGIDSLV